MGNELDYIREFTVCEGDRLAFIDRTGLSGSAIRRPPGSKCRSGVHLYD
jgi:hypothetical protein